MSNRIIVIGDIHFKTEPIPFYNGIINLFHEHIIPEYKDDIIILTGDVMDSASKVRWDLYDEVIHIFNKFKEVHINLGNHDYSDTVGNSLKPLTRLSNVNVYTKETEKIINGFKFLFLPYQDLDYMQKTYTTYEWEGDYCVTHIAPPDTSYGIGEIELQNIKVKKAIIHGHIHTYSEFTDKLKNKNIILGVPQTTRNLEQESIKKVCVIDNTGNYKLSPLPIYYTIQDINFGEFPENKNNALNVKNAPSKKAVFDLYKDYFVRIEGIQCKINQEEVSIISLDDIQNKNESLLENRISHFYKDRDVSNEVQNCINSYFLKTNNIVENVV
jgi:DNA repair exonuclease SbcCD nuclease subunit